MGRRGREKRYSEQKYTLKTKKAVNVDNSSAFSKSKKKEGREVEKIIRVNMSKLEVSEANVPPKYKMLGGRALTSRITLDEVEATCNSLEAKNKIVFAPGLLGGTSAPCSGRLSIGGKSPLTGGIKEANSGGTVGRMLAKLGIGALIIEGKPTGDKWYILRLSKDGIKILPANELKGLGNYNLAEKIQNSYGKQISMISIGQAGEMLMSGASIAISDRDNKPSRQAARGGLGAVLGSKRIKAIIIDEKRASEKICYHNADLFKEISRKLTRELTETKKALTKYGTSITLETSHLVGCMPTRNFSRGQFEGYKIINHEKLYEIITQRGGKPTDACMVGCPIRCANVYNDEEGNYLTSTLQYESIVMLGPNCEIDDWDTIAKLNFLCNDYGLDTIEMGATLGVVMEGGLLLFGDGKRAIKLLEEVGQGTVLGRVIGQGAYITGKVFGVRRVPVAKRQGLPAYDPRALKGTGVTYATSPMGADHTAGNALPGRPGITPGLNLDILSPVDKIKLSQELQIIATSIDVSGLCFFVGPVVKTMGIIADLLSAKLGLKINSEDVLDMGRETLKIEREFNRRAGFTEADDRLPDFFLEEKFPPHNTVFDVPQEEFNKVFKF